MGERIIKKEVRKPKKDASKTPASSATPQYSAQPPLVKKEKKKRKPGYKNKIKRAIKRDEQQKRKIARRQEMRNARKGNR